ncbi:YdeI/OmpD-associated family protein [Paracoccus sulfuroxidans]|uniref:Uncharacterized protein YdeI (YjbR/CyaY-like superfamily) n=1 Tax=Paracoccus sulfuroxidans TaxID=384678 RepID=A0A562NM77_9RHOB|nr:YdeI/OmpD-associated family protein [Paracoccus sulfuroxidans]TWI33309.1 uncharacterized protein YdeI (YjbR/CyaY-like superfamily) [Paracoccus sulfuroxidans]
MTKDLDTHFANLTQWRDELLALREILVASGLTEEWKWRSPVYTHGGHNVAIIWGFKDRATLGFFKGVLLDDPATVLRAQSENSRTSRIVDFTSTDQIKALEPALKQLIADAITKADDKIDLPKDDLAYPDELTERLAADPELATAFDALTPGRRRSWVLHISQAKQSQTRHDRIDRARPKIMASKGMNDR